MKITCPTCRREVPADQINMSKDLAFCPRCNEGFSISETVSVDPSFDVQIQDPPKGCWFRQEVQQVVIGASTRSPMAFFIVPFMCVWSGGSLGGIYGSQIVKGEFDVTLSLFGIPFLLGSLLFWGIALMTICGKIEVVVGRESYQFTGVGRLGRKRKFDWREVHRVREEHQQMNYPGSQPMGIVLEGDRRLKFGSGLNENRRYFVLNALKYLKARNP